MKSTLASCVLYLAVVAWLTWPLAAHLATHLPATSWTWQFDGLYGVWALAWQSHALATDPFSLADTNIFHPANDTLFYGPTALGALPWFAPFFLATENAVLAMNATFLLGLALTATTLHLVVRRWTGSHAAGTVAAGTWLATPHVLWSWIPTVPYHAVLPWYPLIVWRAARAFTGGRAALGFAALLVLQCLTDFAYVTPSLLAPLGTLALIRLVRPATRAAGLWLLAALGLAALALAPVAAGYLAVRASNPDLGQQTPWTVRVPTELPWGPLRGSGPTAVPVTALALIGVGVLASRARGGEREERIAWAHAALWSVVGLVIALTPVAMLRGRPIDIWPHILADRLGLYQLVRVPPRLGVAALFGLAILAGLGLAACARVLGGSGAPRPARATAAGLAALVLAAIYLEYARGGPLWLRRPVRAGPYPIESPLAPSSRLAHIIATHGGPLLELPIGSTGLGEIQHARAMYGSIFHWQPLLNGYSSYWPAGFRERMALALRLPDPEALQALRRETGLRLILVHTAGLYLPRGIWLSLAGTVRPDIRLLARDGDDLLFAVGEVRAE